MLSGTGAWTSGTTHEVAPWHAENRSELGYWHKVLSLVPTGPGHAKLWERPQEANVTSITPSVQFKMAVVGRLSPQIALRESRKYNTVTSHDDAKNYRKSTCLFKSLLKLTDHPTTPLPTVPHMCVSESDQYWFIYWLVAFSVPSHYLSQCWIIVSWILWNNFQWILSAKWRTFCPGRNELTAQ